ncbi:MAG: carboxypeptidase-like regulatory domain-containing protein [Acidobacteriaceae bacterium]
MALALLLLFVAVPVFGQTAQITGIVTDPNTAVVVGASVTLTNQQTHVPQSCATNAEGIYRFDSLTPGSFRRYHPGNSAGPPGDL